MLYGQVVRVNGYLTIAMGVTMLPCLMVDLLTGQQSPAIFGQSAGLALLIGVLVVIATSNNKHNTMSIREAFLLTSGTWFYLPVVGALPFILGAPEVNFLDAYFEAVSGMTTTGATVFEKIEDLPAGTQLWRGILQWLGGLGIVVVAMIFLPVMRVGGMQFFRSEGFDTLGKVMPRAPDIARSLLELYILLTLVCTFSYILFGMPIFDAAVVAMTTVSTGGFATSDASFAAYSGPLEYVSSVFMLIASMPFIRFIQLSRGQVQPLWQDVQVRSYLRWTGYAIASVVVWRLLHETTGFWVVLRETTFNIVTLFSGTGFASADVVAWGSFPLSVIFIVGLIGGCTASTGCSVKVFRWLVLIEAIKTQVRRIQSPNAILKPRLGAQPIPPDVFDSVIAFFALFTLTFGLLTVALDLTGLHISTAITAAWTSIANVGPAYGPEVSGSGALDAFPAAAKWLMIFGMLVGRLEVLSVFVLFTRTFWQD
ncbi:TrkH family potassium uptake protein [Thalassovita taeanensis]|uniref:Trk system potassium uptake protein n=1 Tax=Thalassovita taeanensis TaxID=657014 RepID=A0A1H9HTB1_9RHOB|nr:TrkH family potassium uptake protein [Thalassovita taeanensis]SEQ65561.1 trk system potassium uptake protein TrkH [Thalassovita taeanensis]